MTPEQNDEQHRARAFGWASLLVWASLGFALEAAHGLKLGSYLDDELTRLLLRLGHAHGVGLALVVILYSVSAVPVLAIQPAQAPLAGRLLRAASVLMPLGFTLSAFGHPEGDPSIAVLLVPLGAIALLTSLALIARALRHPGKGPRDS
jgi:hypothetical protein